MSYVNAAVEAIDKAASTWKKNKVALYWEGENGVKKKYTFLELSILSNKFANLSFINFWVNFKNAFLSLNYYFFIIKKLPLKPQFNKMIFYLFIHNCPLSAGWRTKFQ